MAKKKRSIESTLADAEKFFKRGNFQLAQRGFETAQQTLQRDDIAQKIKICERENRTLRVKNLIKKANRALSKNDLSIALANFREALTLQDEPEEWVKDKIEALENVHLAGRADADAAEAEADGNFADAASFYALAAKKIDDRNLLLKSASCLVRAGDYFKAVTCFAQLIDLKDCFQSADNRESFNRYGDRFLYDYGFALAKTGCCINALYVWRSLSDKNKVFLEQKRAVFSIALSEIHESFQRILNNIGDSKKSSDQSLDSTQSSEPFSELQSLSAQADHLYAIFSDLGNALQQNLLKKMCDHLKYELLERAWNRCSYETVLHILEQMAGANDAWILSLKARAAFHLSQKEPSYLKTMVTYWLTAIYSLEISSRFSSDPLQRGMVQQKLIKMADSMVNSHVNRPEGASAARQLNLERRLIDDLLKIASRAGVDGESAYAELICTPIYGALYGLSKRVLKLIISNRDRFDSAVHYLETGGYYCMAWKSLYLMKTGELDKAVSHLDSLPQEIFDDEFSRYVRQLVHYEYGKAAIGRRQKDFLKYFDETHLLFEINPDLEKQIVDFINDYNNMEAINQYEQVIALLYARNPSDSMAKIFSFVMIQSAISRANIGVLQPRAMKIIAMKALDLDPDNEYARQVVDTVEIHEESEEIMRSMARRKFVKAAKIVNASRHLEVEDHFFEGIEGYMGQCKRDYSEDPEFALVLLQEMYESALTVDSEHSVTQQMEVVLSIWRRNR